MTSGLSFIDGSGAMAKSSSPQPERPRPPGYAISLMLMHLCYTVAPSFKFIDSILKAIKNEMGFEGLRELETCLPSRWCCICAYSRLVCTIDTSSRINAKLGGVNALPT
jgi:hypothetical protein